MRRRRQEVGRSFAHGHDTGRVRRAHLRGHKNTLTHRSRRRVQSRAADAETVRRGGATGGSKPPIWRFMVWIRRRDTTRGPLESRRPRFPPTAAPYLASIRGRGIPGTNRLCSPPVCRADGRTVRKKLGTSWRSMKSLW